MKVYMGTDHAGYELKEKLKAYLSHIGYEIEDMGAFEFEKQDDYPDFVKPAAQAVASDTETMGVVFGCSGQGEAMCANKVQGARAFVYYGGPLDIVRFAREHNNANIISFGAKFVTEEEAKQAVKLFLETKFPGEERHLRRIQKM